MPAMKSPILPEVQEDAPVSPELNPYLAPNLYYGTAEGSKRKPKTRAYSTYVRSPLNEIRHFPKHFSYVGS